MAKDKDVFSNIAHAAVTQAVINTLTFSEISTGISVHEKIAWLIARISWYPLITAYQEFSVAGDSLTMALVLSNKVTDIGDLSDPAIVDSHTLFAGVHGTPANAIFHQLPEIVDFTDLPGGGLIITPKPIYVAINTTTFAAVTTVKCRIHYTTKVLTTDEFWELVQASRIVE